MLSKLYTVVGLPADPLMSMMASYLRSRKQKNKEECSLAEKTPPESSSNTETNPATTFEISEYFGLCSALTFGLVRLSKYKSKLRALDFNCSFKYVVLESDRVCSFCRLTSGAIIITM